VILNSLIAPGSIDRRGNRINDLIAPFRPTTMEAVAGKNAVTHVGKLYNIAASLIAHRLAGEVEGVSEAQCFLLSQIGRQLDQPQAAQVAVRIPPELAPMELRGEVEAIIDSDLLHLRTMSQELLDCKVRIGRWPLTGVGP
jgi:S-adenosylmethionine synthetase